jgi:superfamily I DNA/RNA helicase/RecB family exonuclease
MSSSAFSEPARGVDVRLRRQRLDGAPPVALDEAQRRVVAHRGGPLRVVGGPGSGKTTALVEAVVDRVQRGELAAGELLVLAPTRLAAARLREQVTGRLARTVREPLVRTPQSLAFGILRRVAARSGGPQPRLISGPEQDVVLRELLAGHAAGDGRPPRWPADLLGALTTRGFRAELRDLLMRAVERGVDPAELSELGIQHGRPDWVAAAQVLDEYLGVTGLATPGAYDPAAIAVTAAAELGEDDELLAQVREQARCLAVDDAHEATPAVAELVRVLAGAGGELLLAGDPDAVTQSFRGADPGLLLHDAPGSRAAVPTVLLTTSWRQGSGLRAVTRRVADRIGALGGGGQRDLAPASGLPDGRCEVHVLRSAVHEAAFVAELLRRQHLEHGVGWADMAVVVRGGARSATLRRVLTAAGVPVEVPLSELPVRDQPAVVPLLDVLEISLALAAGHEPPLDGERAAALLTSPLGGADAVGLRRLRRALRAAELADGGGRTSDELLVAALLDPVRLAAVEAGTAAPAHRVARVITDGARAAATEGATAEQVLWAVWSGSRLQDVWRRTAFGGGQAGARADRDLDAVVALFDAAARFVDRLPGAGAGQFVEHLRAQDVPGDTLAERGGAAEAVALVTPAGAAGREWRVVAVAGVQEGVWPDLRLRGSLLGSEHLVDVLTGRPSSPRAALAAVRDDECRLLHVAVSRARELLVVTAVRDEDEQPSSYLDLLDPPPDPSQALPTARWDADGQRRLTPAPRPLSLPGLTASLRQTVTDPVAAPGRVAQAAAQLARLARAGVPGADPADWYGLEPLSDPRPLRLDGEPPVRVSPSAVEDFDRCSLRWLLSTAGGRSPSSAAQGLGNLVHDLARDLPKADREELLVELRRRWRVLGLGAGWVGDAERSRAERVVGKLADYLAEHSWDLVDVERAFEVELDLPDGPAVVTGRVDRLERDVEGHLRVVDLKTGKRAPSADDLERHAQLGVYQVAVQRGAFPEGARTAGATLAQLGSGEKRVKVQHQPAIADDGDWAVELLGTVASGMAAGTFAATVNDLCERCSVRGSCPAVADGRPVTS